MASRIISVATVLLAILSHTGRATEDLANRRPNVVLVITDDQGYGDLACHGNPVVKTPNLDRLHGESVRFTRFHVSPTCAPTRAALLTGRHEFHSGVTHTINERERLSLSSVTYAQVLKDAGFDLSRDFARQEYLGNHEAVLLAVLEGRVDAGATYQGAFAALRRSKGVDPLTFRIIAKTSRTPRDIFCVPPTMPAEVAEAITAALLPLNGRDRAGREILGPLNLNGFTVANDRAYDEVRAVAAELTP